MKLTILFLLFAFIYSSAFGQEQLKHEKKIYRSPEGRLFINKTLPVYLRLATSPDDNAKTHLLQSEATKKYANPMYFDTEGYNTLRSPSAVDTVTKKTAHPIQDVIFEVYADSETPRSRIDFGTKNMKTVDGVFYVGKDISLSIKADDKLSGIENVLFSVDNAGYKPLSGTIPITQQKEYIVKYYSVDNVGNFEKAKEKKFTLDNEAPVSTHEIDGEKKDNILSKRTKIKLASKDNLSGVKRTYYSIDNSKPKLYSGPIYIGYLGEGEHTLTYYSVDQVNNEEEKRNYVFFLDKTPPIVVEEVLGDQFYVNGKAYSSGRTKLKITAVDNRAGVKAIYYSIGGGEKQLYTKPFYLPSKSGAVVVKSYAVDYVNNESGTTVESSRIHATYVDLTGPSLNYYYSGPKFKYRDTIYISDKTNIVLKASDSESGMKKITYSIDKKPETDYDGKLHSTDEGPHNITFFGYDNVNNSNLSNLNFITDISGPEIFVFYSIVPYVKEKTTNGTEIDVFPSHAVVFLAATDKKVGYDRILYSVNGNAERRYQGPISGFKSGNDYTLKIRAIDKLGNETNKEVVFRIKN